MPIACNSQMPLLVYTHCHWPFSIVSNLPGAQANRVSASHGAYCSALAELVCSQLDASQDDNARTRLISGPSSRAAGGSICLRDSNLGESAFSHTMGGGGGSSPSAILIRMTYSPRTEFKYPIRSLRQVCPRSSLIALSGAGCPASIASDQGHCRVVGPQFKGVLAFFQFFH